MIKNQFFLVNVLIVFIISGRKKENGVAYVMEFMKTLTFTWKSFMAMNTNVHSVEDRKQIPVIYWNIWPGIQVIIVFLFKTH